MRRNERMTSIDEGQPIIVAQDVGKQVPMPGGALTILEGVSFEVKAGERVAILGVSGSGKSTLIGLLAGLDQPSHGRIRLAGEELSALDEDGRARLRGRTVGFVFQTFQLLPGLTALENAMLPLELAGRSDAESAARDLLARVGLAARAHHYPRQLSGGEQQRVALARAFATSPAVLFADEPTGNLDAHTGEKIADLLFDLNREAGTTLVLVTHDERMAARCGRRLHLDAGRLVRDER
ncbi:MAG: ABC transporter ATP-binding protein [Betaproteobacteria bacterium]|nr:ABC transporter ATP-binding protein [Betaproteobacteria bacterium]MDE2622535.1 ABC transporter ATP-binding protein [Betaproteobacteria bacterium]